MSQLVGLYLLQLVCLYLIFYRTVFDTNLNNIEGKFQQFLSLFGQIFRSFFLHKISLLRHAYITFVHPILEYAAQVWNSSVLKYISELETVQRNFTFHTRSLKHLSYPERLAVEPLELRSLNEDLLMYYYKIINNLIFIYFDDHFTVWISSSISTYSSGPLLSYN